MMTMTTTMTTTSMTCRLIYTHTHTLTNTCISIMVVWFFRVLRICRAHIQCSLCILFYQKQAYRTASTRMFLATPFLYLDVDSLACVCKIFCETLCLWRLAGGQEMLGKSFCFCIEDSMCEVKLNAYEKVYGIRNEEENFYIRWKGGFSCRQEKVEKYKTTACYEHIRDFIDKLCVYICTYVW